MGSKIKNLFWLVMLVIGFALFYEFGFAVFGAAGGFLIGWAISAYYEEVLGIGNPQGPLLFLLTAPAGFLLGFLYGIWKAIRNRNLYLHFS